MDIREIRNIMLKELVEVQARNPKYSMRAFAQRIGVSQAAVSQILSGKRPLTHKSAARILMGLDRPPSEIEKLLVVRKRQKSDYQLIEADKFHLISDWHYFAILSLAETDDFHGSAQWVASRLGITEQTANAAIERLVRLGLLSSEQGTIAATGQQFEIEPAVAHPALKKACRQNIEMAAQALDATEFSERDFTAMTLCFDPGRMKEAITIIQQFRKKFCDLMESGKKSEVYKLSINLYPLSKVRKAGVPNI